MDPKLHVFVVQGRGTFPFDMLRYDRCWPRRESESGKIDKTTHRNRDGALTHTIELAGLGKPTVGRWESFGWKVTPLLGRA